MSAPENPGQIPYHAEAVDVALPTVARDGGYVPQTIADPKVANALGKQAGRWIQYLDIGRPSIGDLFSDQAALARGQSIEFPTALGLGPLTPTELPTVYAGGCRIFYSQAILELSGVYENTFAASARTYFYGNGPTEGVDQVVQIDVVGLLDPPNPPAGFIDLGGVETDAVNVVSLIPSTLGGQIVVNADLLFSLLSAEQAIIDASSLSGVNALDITGTGDAGALLVDGSGNAGATIFTTDGRALTLSNNAPVAPTLTVTNSDAAGSALTVVSGTVALQGASTTIGTAGTDTCTVNATVDLASGGSVNGVLNMNDTLVIQGASGGALSTDIFAVCNFNGTTTLDGRVNIASTTSSFAGDLSRDGGDSLEYHDGTGTKLVHFSEKGWVRGYGRADTIATGPSAQLNTDTAVAPRLSADLDISCEFWVQRVLAGDIIIAINEVGGAGQIGTNQTLTVTATGGNNWDRVSFSRTKIAADTVPYVYQLDVQGNGSNVTVHEARISVLPIT